MLVLIFFLSFFSSPSGRKPFRRQAGSYPWLLIIYQRSLCWKWDSDPRPGKAASLIECLPFEVLSPWQSLELPGSPWPRSLVCNLSHTRGRCSMTWSFFERPLIRFLSPPRGWQAEGGTVFRKASDQRVQDFQHSGAFLPDTLVQDLQFWGHAQHSESVHSPAPSPASLPCPHSLKDHFSPGSFNSWKLKFVFFEISLFIWGYLETHAVVRSSSRMFKSWSKHPIWSWLGARGYFKKSAKLTWIWS